MKLLSTSSLFFFLFVCFIVISVTIPTNKELGLLYFESYQYEKAFAYLKNEMKNSNQDLKILKTMKDYFLLRGQNQNALEIQKQLVSLRPNNEKYYHELEKLYDWNLDSIGKLDTQRQRAELYAGEKRINLLIEVAEGYRWAREYKKADEVYSMLRERFSSLSPEQRESIINYYMATKNKVVVLELLNKVNDKERLRPLYIDSLAQIYLNEKDYVNAIKYLKIIIASYDESLARQREFLTFLDPIDVLEKKDKIHYLIEAYLKLGNIDLAKEVENQLLLQLGKSMSHVLELAYLYQTKGYIIESERLFREIIVNDSLLYPSEEAVKQATDFFLDDKHPTLVFQGYLKLYKLNPKKREYVKFLAEYYEKAGNKRKALKFYKKLLELEKKSAKHSLWKEMMKKAVAINVDVKEFELQKLPTTKLNQSQLKQNRIAETEYKILYLHEDLKEYQEAEKVYKSLLNKYPRRKELLQGLAYNLWNRGKIKEAYYFFERLLDVSPRDEDALELLSGRYFLEKRFKNAAFYKVKQLKYHGLDFSGYSILEESLFQIDKLKSHSKLCKQLFLKRWDRSVTRQQELELNYRCALRIKDNKRSIYYATKLANLTRLDPYYSDAFYMAVDAGNYVYARKVLKMIKDHKIAVKNFKEMQQMINEYFKKPEVYSSTSKEEVKSSHLDISQQIISQNEFTFSQTQGFGLINKDQIPFGPVARFNKGLNGSEESHYQIGLGSLLRDGSEQWFGFLGLLSGNKESTGTGELSYSQYDENNYLNIRGFYNRPATESQLLFETGDAVQSGVDGYFESDNIDIWTLAGGFRVYDFFNDRSSQDYESGTYLFHLYKDFYLGPALYRGKFHQTNRVSTVYVPNSLAYAARAYFRKKWDNKKNEFNLGFNLGGDIEREISFGGVIALQSNYSYLWNENSWLKVNFEYLRESVSVTPGDTIVFGVNYNSWF